MKPHPTVAALAATLALAAFAPHAHAQAAGPISVTSVADIYTQSFDTLASTGTIQSWSNGRTLQGWYLFTGGSTNGPTSISVSSGVGIAAAARAYSAGSTGSTDRALGVTTLTGTAGGGSIVMAMALTNDTGTAQDGFSLLYDSEQWSYGNSSLPSVFTMDYRFGDAYALTGWTALGAAFSSTSTVNSGSPRALDGNAPENRTADVGGTQLVTWAPGATLWLRWVDNRVSQNGIDSLMALDNVRFGAGVTPIPEPGTWALMLLGLGCVGALARRRTGRGAPQQLSARRG